MLYYTFAILVKTVGLTLGVLITKKKQNNSKTKGHEETFRGDEYVYYIDCGEDYIAVCYVQTHQIVHLNRYSFVYQLYLNKAVKKIRLKKWKHNYLNM